MSTAVTWSPRLHFAHVQHRHVAWQADVACYAVHLEQCRSIQPVGQVAGISVLRPAAVPGVAVLSGGVGFE